MTAFLKRCRHLAWLLLFPLLTGGYFLISRLNLPYHIIHVPLDDRIPFLPVFVVPYVLWYLYISLPMAAVGLHDAAAFRQQARRLFSGWAVGLVCFLVYPSAIDFRPSAEGPGVLLWLCRWLYGRDLPRNVLPSLHCYGALVTHLSLRRRPLLRKHLPLRLGSAVLAGLICLFTVLIRQHSVVDLAAGCLLAVLTHVFWTERENHHDRRAV